MNRFSRIGLLSVLLLGALIFASACTQTPAVQNVTGGGGDPTAQQIYVTSSGSLLVYALPTTTGADEAAPVSTFTGFGDAHAVAFDASGNAYVTDFDAAEGGGVYVFNPAGVLTATLTAGFDFPDGIAVDSHGKIYVANEDNNSVTIYPASPTSTSTPNVLIAGEATGLSCPRGLALDLRGRIFVANSTPTEFCTEEGTNFASTVTFYAASIASTTSGATVNATPAGTITNAPTGFCFLHGVTFDAAGNLYVADACAASVTVYNSAGYVTPIATISGANTGIEFPNGVAVDAKGNVYVADAETDTVLIFDAVEGKIPSGNIAPTATISIADVGTGTLHGVTVH